ncbi:MAG: hypothetical protein AAF734_02125 [Bacteroidota bacterium]
MMQELKRLAHFVKQKCQSTLPFVDFYDAYNQEDKLFHHLPNIDSDEAALALLYPETTEDTHRALQSVKGRLKEKLMNSLLYIDFNRFVKTDKLIEVEMEARRYYDQARILSNFYGDHKEAKKRFKKALAVAQRYELHALTLDCLEFLLNPMLSKDVPPKTRKHYARLQETTFTHYQVQFKASQLDRDMRSVLNGLQKTTCTQAAKKSILEEVKEGMAALRQLWQDSGLTSVYYQYHRFITYYYQVLGNWQGMLDHIAQSEQTLQEGVLNEQVFDRKFGIYMKTLAYLMLRQYQAGLAYIPYALQHFKEEENNYFAIQLHHLLLAIRAADYPRAFEILARKETLHNFRNVSQSVQEEWYMAEAYLQFITESEPLHFQTIYDHVPMMRADKEGMNLNLLILQLLLLLRAGELLHFERTFYNSFRALKRLPAKKRGKADTFFRLLHHLIKQDYHPARTRDAARHLVDKLEAIEPGITSSNFEIVPYSRLWNYTLGLLERLPVKVERGEGLKV